MLVYTKATDQDLSALAEILSTERGVMQVGLMRVAEVRHISQALCDGAYYGYFATQPVWVMLRASQSWPRHVDRPTRHRHGGPMSRTAGVTAPLPLACSDRHPQLRGYRRMWQIRCVSAGAAGPLVLRRLS